jgi:DNA-binding CsgD family transcriptional regulator
MMQLHGPTEELADNPYEITRREAEVVEYLAAGLRTLEIAERMFISPHTVNDHVRAVLRKTGTRTRAAAVARLNSEAAQFSRYGYLGIRQTP